MKNDVVALNIRNGIPNVQGGVFDDGYRPRTAAPEKKQMKVTVEYDDHVFSGLLTER